MTDTKIFEKRRVDWYSNFLAWPFKENETVLDVGGGDGYLGSVLKERYKTVVTNLEIVKFKKNIYSDSVLR